MPIVSAWHQHPDKTAVRPIGMLFTLDEAKTLFPLKSTTRWTNHILRFNLTARCPHRNCRTYYPAFDEKNIPDSKFLVRLSSITIQHHYYFCEFSISDPSKNSEGAPQVSESKDLTTTYHSRPPIIDDTSAHNLSNPTPSYNI